jgi:hypothetical protein
MKLEIILDELIQKHSLNFIVENLNVSKNTIQRWMSINKVPNEYKFELYRLNGMDVDYTLFSFKEKDQFFTPKNVSEKCFGILQDVLKTYNDTKLYTFVEPSVGNGSFFQFLPKGNRIGIDIEPQIEDVSIFKKNYLDWKPENQDPCIVIGNPPFGLRGNLALKFINHSTFADYVAFILPPLFESDGKGTPGKRVKGFNLIHSQKIDNLFETPTGKEIKVECIFQIWSKYQINKEYSNTFLKKTNDNIKIYSLSDGGTPSSTRNKSMLNKCDIYLPSTCFGKENMRTYTKFEDLPNQRGYGIVFIKDKENNIKRLRNVDWVKVSFLSTNSAFNLRSSQIFNNLEKYVY